MSLEVDLSAPTLSANQPSRWSNPHRDVEPTGWEPALSRFQEHYCRLRLDDEQSCWPSVCESRLRPLRGWGWAVPLAEKLRDIDWLAEYGSPAALAHLQRLLTRVRVNTESDAGDHIHEYTFPQARGSLADALVHWEVWFDGERVDEYKSEALARLEAVVARLESQPRD